MIVDTPFSREQSNITLEERMARADSFDMSPILLRYKRKRGATDEQCKTLETELKRYLVMCAENRDSYFGISHELDELWHTFLIFTVHYSHFCAHVCGRYIHHSPLELMETVPEVERAKMYANSHTTYKAMFGENPHASIWPPPLGATASAGGGSTRCTNEPFVPPCCDAHTNP